ncbi:MAG: two-component sensor histidine kinase, partial [Burkholderia sp.]|nr:two-component sensor histidine kinase [Burkholderia sp.]
DRGPGIPADQLDAVFEPFRRVETSRNRDTGGTGLGLAIAKQLALAMGGTLTLNNRPDGGGLEARLTLRNTG